jgi:hypothetical protein
VEADDAAFCEDAVSVVAVSLALSSTLADGPVSTIGADENDDDDDDDADDGADDDNDDDDAVVSPPEVVASAAACSIRLS